MRAIRSATASTLPEANGARAMFEGVAIMQLRDGKILEIPRGGHTRAERLSN